jgi:hypothetical protein
MRNIKAVVLLLLTLTALAVAARAQDPTPQPADAQTQPIDATAQPTPTDPATDPKAAAEKQAYALLDDVIADAQGLKLPENRSRMQTAAADLLWKHDEARARTLFTNAAAGIAELMQQQPTDRADRQALAQSRAAMQLRQELVLTVARHDAAFAYQLFQTMRQPATNDNQNARMLPDADSVLEQMLLAQVAATDPDLAVRKAEEMLSKGQYSPVLAAVLAQLQAKDKRAAAQLADKLMAQLQTDNLTSNTAAGSLALSLLRPGPRPEATPVSTTTTTTTAGTAALSYNAQVLSESAYRDLLQNVINVALKATPNTQGVSVSIAPRGGGRGGRGGTVSGLPAQQPDTAQLEQANERNLLYSLQSLLPQVDQYASGRASAVRQKLSELGLNTTNTNTNPRAAFGQYASLMQQGTSDSLLTAAASAPPGIQDRLYQQAALKAVNEGNTDRARQIANDHLDGDVRSTIMQAIDSQQTVRKAKANQLEDVRQTLARLPSDDDRVQLLLQLADAAHQDNPKQAQQFLEEARTLVSRRATNYQQLSSQLQVAHAYAPVDPARSFELLELGIGQLNELMPAAALLSGFELSIFKDGEMSLPGYSGLGQMVMRYGQELAALAKTDFARAHTTADQFQYPEARIIARLSIVQGVLGTTPVIPNNRFNRRGGFLQAGPFIRQQ